MSNFNKLLKSSANEEITQEPSQKDFYYTITVNAILVS